MVALPNIGGVLYSTPRSVADAHYYTPCSNAAKTRNQLKCGGVPQSNEMISAASGPKFTILWGHLEDILLLNKFFSDCRCVPYLRRYSPTKLCYGAQMAIFGDFLRPVFSASRVQHISDLHCKFTLKCGQMSNVMVALPNTGGALCSTTLSLADAHY